MIKNKIQYEIPIQTWLKILKAIIEPIALYGSEIRGPLKTQDFSKWEKEEIEIMHTQICKNILKVNRATPNNSCRAELGQYPLLINIQKRAVKFHQHLKCSDLTRLKLCSGRSRTCRRVHYYSWYSHYTQTSTTQSDPTTSHSYKNTTTSPIGNIPLKYKRR